MYCGDTSPCHLPTPISSPLSDQNTDFIKLTHRSKTKTKTKPALGKRPPLGNKTARSSIQPTVITSLELVTQCICISCLTLSTTWYCYSVYISLHATFYCCVYICSHSDFTGAGLVTLEMSEGHHMSLHVAGTNICLMVMSEKQPQ